VACDNCSRSRTLGEDNETNRKSDCGVLKTKWTATARVKKGSLLKYEFMNRSSLC